MELLELCQSASDCKGAISKLSADEKNVVLHTAADLLKNKEDIFVIKIIILFLMMNMGGTL